jgi:hypothetical protein
MTLKLQAKTNWSLIAATICFSIIITLALAEILVRMVLGSPWPERLPLVRVMPDEEIGWRMIPGDSHYTYDIPVKLNANGFRGPEVKSKLANEYRILAVGDSHVYGQGIADEALMTTVLQQHLNQRQQQGSVRVINMGVRAYSLNQEVALIEQVGLAFEPDHIILFYYINDFVPTNIAKRYADFKDSDWYMFDIEGKPSPDVLVKWHARQFLRNSALVMWSNDMYRAWSSSGNDEQLILEGKLSAQLEMQFAEAAGYLKHLFHLSERQGVRFTVVAIPVVGQLARDYPNERYQSWLTKLSTENGIDYIDLLPAMREMYGTIGYMPTIPYDGHYDAVAQRYMALGLVEHLTRTISLVKSRKSHGRERAYGGR